MTIYDEMSASQFLSLFEERQNNLDEGAVNVVLDLIGLVPGVGEVADLANTVLYLKSASNGENPKTNVLMAALSLVSVFPAIGDVVGKGGKIAVTLAKSGKLGKVGAKAAPAMAKIQQTLAKNSGKINELFDALAARENALKNYVPAMKKALAQFTAGNLELEVA